MIGGTISHYEVLELLERRDAGAVYRARDRREGGDVALEVLPRPADAELAERFRREIEAASALGHPHVWAALEVGGTADGQLFVARSLADGESLRSRMHRGPLPPEQAVGFASQIAAALGRAHQEGLVHAAVRPAHILITAGGEARVGGFGLAGLVPSNGASPLDEVAYRAPEQLCGGPVDARTDVWSLAVILYEMVTGRVPFRGRSREELVSAILERSPEPMASFSPGVPPELEAALGRALAKRPAERPARMDDLLVALRGILAAGGLAEDTVVQVPGARGSRPASEVQAGPEPAPEMTGLAAAHYRVLEKLGSGSMGTVYRAEDTRLRRRVALKFLPPALVRDEGAKARFLQEAQAASALDHPNICTVHEVGQTDDGQLFLAMAGYDGETVQAKVGRGPLPVAEAVEIARQAARGLAKAHRHGIVHRDIKPANLMVTADGVVKVLDFGVAKLRGTVDGLNVAGSFLGTPAYMSPEQARGESVDPRADVWSLGVVLYEMLAGSRPFGGGDDLGAVLRSLLEDRPAPLGRVRPGVPPELERIVERMLARSPADRHADAAGVLAELEAFQGSLAGPPSVPRPHRHLWIGAALLAAAVLAAVAAVYLAVWGSAAPAAVQPVFTRLTGQEGRETYPALSPDGERFVFVRSVGGQSDIFAMPVGGGAPVNLTEGSPADDTHPAFSPDGRWLAFRSERDGGGIFILPAEGGPARRLSEIGQNPAWSPDGREIAVATEGVVDPSMRKADSQIWVLDVATGRRRVLVEADGVQPSWSPSGRRIAYWGLPKGGSRRMLWTVPAAGGPPSVTLDDGHINWNPVWSPDGRHLYFGSDRSGSLNLWRLPVDERTGEARGEPQPLTTPAMASGFWSVSSDGRQVLYAANESKSNLERYRLDPESLRVSGPESAVTRGSLAVRSCDVSPDGAWIAFHADAQPWEDLFVVGADGGGLRRLTEDAHRDRHPVWSPDGRRLLFYSNRRGSYEVWSLDAAGGEPEPILPGAPAEGMHLTNPVWSPDGRRVACTLGSKAAVVDLTLPLQERRLELLPPADALRESFYPNSWSPDGERLAGNMARLDDSIPEGIGSYFLRSRTYERWTSHGANPIWLHDGRRLLYTESGRIHAFDSETREARLVLAPPAGSAFTSVSTSPDDRSLLAVRAVDEGDVWLLTFKDSGEDGS